MENVLFQLHLIKTTILSYKKHYVYLLMFFYEKVLLFLLHVILHIITYCGFDTENSKVELIHKIVDRKY